MAAVVLGVGAAEEAAGAGLSFRPENILEVVEGAAAAVLAGVALNRGDAEAAADVVGLNPPNEDGAGELLAGGLLNKLLVVAGVVDEVWVLVALAVGVLL